MTGFTEVFRTHAQTRPAKPALLEGDRTIDFRSLDRRINGACFALTRAGVAREAVVGVALRDTVEHLILMLALARIGAVIAPMDCRWNQRETLSVAGHFKASRVLVEPGTPLADPNWLTPGADWCAETDRVYRDAAVTIDA